MISHFQQLSCNDISCHNADGDDNGVEHHRQQHFVSCLRFQQPSCNIDDIDIDNGDVDDDNGGAVGHHRQEEEERAINYLSFEVSTTAAAAAADSSPALFSFQSRKRSVCRISTLSLPAPLQPPYPYNPEYVYIL